MRLKTNIATLLIILLTALASPLLAQQPSYTHYQVEDGLPSMQIYNMMQDSKGFIWMATSMGLSRFDGTRFVNYTTADGLPDNEVLDIAEDEQGKIWLQTAQGKRCFVGKKGIEPGQTDLFGDQVVQAGDIAIDYILSLRYQQDSLQQKLLPNQSQYFQESITCQLDDGQAGLWLGTWGGGAFQVQHYQTDSLQVRTHLPNKTITSILVDREQNTWFATFGEGVYLLSNPGVRTYTTAQGLANNEIHSLAIDDTGRIWAGNNKGVLSLIDKDTIQNFELTNTPNSYNRINDIFMDAEGRQWVSMDKGLVLRSNQYQQTSIYSNAVKAVLPAGKDRLWIASYQNPAEYDISQDKAIQSIPLQRVNNIATEVNGKLWLGTTNGLYHYQNDTTFYWGGKDAIFAKSIKDLQFDQQGRLWIATDGHGLLIKQGNTYLQLTTQNGLVSNICQSIFLDQQDQAWLATVNGLQQIHLDGMDATSLKMQAYDRLDGLASNHIHDVLVKGQQVWVATLNGLSVFPNTDMKPSSPLPPIYFSQIEVQNQDTSIQAKYRLAHTQNNLYIEYIGLSYKSKGSINYLYQMVGVDTSWQQTSSNNIRYSALAPGSYTFLVQAMLKDGTRSNKTASVHFEIQHPIWQRWWAYLLMGLLAIATIALVAWWVFQNFKNRNEWQRRLVESEQMALRAQMNPHFIFNSLNSIQYFITNNDKKSANLYLSVFATLMRKVLHHSQQSTISLEEELDYLRLYLDIESLRFKDKFSHEIRVAPDMEIEDIYIPPMLIQPYIENAIQHGLLRKENGDRRLLVDFNMKGEELLTCQIEDNGIGRAQANALKKNRPEALRKGIGTTNPKERLDILNRLNKEKIYVAFTDLTSDQGEALGTRVLLSIPAEYQ